MCWWLIRGIGTGLEGRGQRGAGTSRRLGYRLNWGRATIARKKGEHFARWWLAWFRLPFIPLSPSPVWCGRAACSYEESGAGSRWNERLDPRGAQPPVNESRPSGRPCGGGGGLREALLLVPGRPALVSAPLQYRRDRAWCLLGRNEVAGSGSQPLNGQRPFSARRSVGGSRRLAALLLRSPPSFCGGGRQGRARRGPGEERAPP